MAWCHFLTSRAPNDNGLPMNIYVLSTFLLGGSSRDQLVSGVSSGAYWCGNLGRETEREMIAYIWEWESMVLITFFPVIDPSPPKIVASKSVLQD
jgi:hypothetical protein